jgi:DMSO reductase anchor subunit
MLMFLVFVYGVMHYFEWDTVLFTSKEGAKLQLTLVVGIIGAIATFGLFLCTGMIYACLKFLQEWHSPLTVINYTLLGTASGFVLATAFASHSAPELMRFFGIWSTIITVAAFITRSASLIRNSRIKAKSSLQTALGVRHNRIQQKSMGFMGGSVNTRDFFNHATTLLFKSMKWIFIVLVFIVPMIVLWSGMARSDTTILLSAFGIQYIGLIAERWFFFAQANHPQNLYYQTV